MLGPHYRFAFPALKLPEPARATAAVPLTQAKDGAQYAASAAAACEAWLSGGGASAWLIHGDGGVASPCQCAPLTQFWALREFGGKIVLAFADPCAVRPGILSCDVILTLIYSPVSSM